MSAPASNLAQVEVSEKEIAAAENKAAAQKAEDKLTEAKRRLVKAETELDAEKDVLREAQKEDPVDAQRVAKAELCIAEAKLGVAKAELGVAKAELGVAKAELQAAPENEKAVFLAIVETAQECVESANMAYKMALTATATQQQGAAGGAQAASGQGVRLVLPPEPQGLAEPGSNEEDIQKSMSLDALSKLLKRNRTGGAIGKYKQLSDILGKNCLDVWGQNCAMSHLPPDEGLTHNLAHIIPQAALKQEHTIYPVSKDLRRSINGGIFSTLNVLPMHPTIEQWFDAGFFCVQASGEIVMNERLSNDSSLRMAPWFPTYVSEKIRRSGPLMAAFKWHKENVFTTPGGVRAMFGGSSTSSAKGSGAGESQQGSHSREGGGSAASGGKSSGNSRGHENRVGTAGPPRTTLSACGLDLLKSLEAIVGLSAHDKVLLWDVGEAETVRANYDEPN